MTWSDGDLLTPTNLNDSSKGSDTVTVTGDNSTRSTKASAVQNAIDRATNQGKAFVFVPESFTNYDASAVTFDNSVRMVREGQVADVYDVKAYGAAMDGVTDDVAAGQAAIDEAPDGSVVWISDGELFLASGLVVENRQALTLAGRGTILFSGIDALTIQPDGSNTEDIIIQGLRFDGQEGAGGRAIVLSHNQLGGGRLQVRVHRVEIEGAPTGIFTQGSGGAKLEVVHSRFTISDVTGSVGIDVNAPDGDYSHNTVRGYETGILVGDGANLIEGNHVFISPSASINRGVDVQAPDNRILGNFLSGADFASLRLNVTHERQLVTGNQFTGAAADGPFIVFVADAASTTIDRVQVVGNNFESTDAGKTNTVGFGVNVSRGVASDLAFHSNGFTNTEPETTIAEHLSATFAVDSTGLKTINQTVDLLVGAGRRSAQVSLVRETDVADYAIDFIRIASVTRTNVEIEVGVGSASATGSATARLATSVAASRTN